MTASHVLIDRDMDRIETLASETGCAAAISARCPGKESPNEDAAAVIHLDCGGSVLIVADGMGGGAAGEVASAIAVRALVDALTPLTGHDMQQLRFAIMNGIEQANHTVLELGVGAATTLAVVTVHDGAVRPYHVGDSLILLVGNRGRIKLQTVPHSPVGYGVEAGLLDEAEAMHHEDRHVVSNIVGTVDMRIEVGASIPLSARDTLLVASDGLSDNLAIDEIVECIRKGQLDKATEKLFVDARQRMNDPTAGHPSKPDDLTLVAYRQNSTGNSPPS